MEFFDPPFFSGLLEGKGPFRPQKYDPEDLWEVALPEVRLTDALQGDPARPAPICANAQPDGGCPQNEESIQRGQR